MLTGTCHWGAITTKSAVGLCLSGGTNVAAHLPVDRFDGRKSSVNLPRDHRTHRNMWF